MPLTEISNNIRRSASHAREKSASDGDSTSTPSLPTSAIQSMLKTTTELGDLGQFATRPSRLPRSGSRLLSTRPRSGSFDASFATALRDERSSRGSRHGRPHGPRPFNSSSGISGRHISQSNLSSHTNGSRRKRYPPGQYRYPLQGHASPGPGPRRLYHHRSLLSLSTHSSLRSGSPVLVPSRMRTPGYQASSSSYSDVRHMSHTPRAGFMRAPSIGTVGSSPASMRPRPYGGPGHRLDVNGSYTSLVRLPSPAVHFNRNGSYPGPVPMRTLTPTSMMVHQQQSMAINHSIGGIPKSPTSSTVPRYYDYSESFVEENCFSPDGAPGATQPPLNMDQTLLNTVPTTPPRDAQTPFGTMAGSSFHPIELPTQHRRRLSDQSGPSFNGVIPKRVSSLGAPALHRNSPEVCQIRRTQSEDSGPSDLGRTDPAARRPSLVSHRSCTPTSSSIFFQSASRSSRDLMTMAARVHSPPVGGKDKQTQLTRAALPHNGTAKSPHQSVKTAGCSPKPTLSSFTFTPISFEYYRPSPSARPRTSEATPNHKVPMILSPMPERPMSSQSWLRFRKILELEDTANYAREKCRQQLLSCSKPRVVNRGDETPDHRHLGGSGGATTVQEIDSSGSCQAQDEAGIDQKTRQVASPDRSSISSLLHRHIDCLGLQPEAHNLSGVAMTSAKVGSATSCLVQKVNDSGLDQKVHQVTSHDSSSITSLLDRHMECLGLQADVNMSEDVTGSECCQKDRLSSAEDNINLTDLLATAPPSGKGRPMTSSSCRHPSLAPFERQRLRPRRLFASMDDGIPKMITERATSALAIVSENKSRTSRPSYGWQTLPSMSRLLPKHCTTLPSLTSGELADVDTPEQERKFKVRRRFNLSMSASEPSHLSESASSIPTLKQSNTLHRKSKRTVLASQDSHRRRRLRIRLQLKTKSETISDLAVDGLIEVESKTDAEPVSPEKASTCQSRAHLLADCYTDLSWETITPSKTASPAAESPVLPTRGSSILATMPKPIEKKAVLSPEASLRTVKSGRRNTSIIEPVNATRLNGPSPPLETIPRLATPQFGPDLTSSELNLSLPYSEIPPPTRPALRETKSFFLDDNSTQRQRTSIRQKLHLHSLSRVLPGSAGHNSSARSLNGANVKVSHSCRLRGRNLGKDEPSLPPDTVGMSEFAYRTRSVLERLKDWWRRQCRLRIHTKKGERTAPGGAGR